MFQNHIFHKMLKTNHLNMNKYYYLLFTTVFLYQCTKKEKLPITEATMSEVLTDIHIAEGAVDNETTEMKDSITMLYYNQIFERNGIKQWQFDSAMSMMSKNPVLMERIFKSVIDKIKSKSVVDSLVKK
jgi:Domain of unknown function (DUF4296)